MNDLTTFDPPSARLPAKYEAAKTAIAECSRVDECKDWADKAAALASYARQAKDDSLRVMALRIQARAERRAGELLKQIPRGDAGGANLVQHRRDGTVPPVITRTQAATDAGLSERQRKTANRLANIPRADFEAAVESDQPPTVTELAARGTVSRLPTPVGSVPAADPAVVGRAQAMLRDFAAFCAGSDALAIAHGVLDADAVRGYVATLDRWLDRLVTHLPPDRDAAA